MQSVHTGLGEHVETRRVRSFVQGVLGVGCLALHKATSRVSANDMEASHA